MKKLSIIIAALLVCGAMQAQTFESICWDFEEDYEAGNILEWTTIDADGDGHCWQLHPTGGMAHNDTDGMVVSYSKDIATGDSLTPSNYLVSPRVLLSEGACINFWTCALDEFNPSEHFSIGVSTTVNDDPLAFTTIYESSISPKNECNSPLRIGNNHRQGEWHQYTIDLTFSTGYSGQEVYVAIRHYWSSGKCAICIDDISLEQVSLGVAETTQSVSVYPNPASDNVKIEGINPAMVQVYNTLGQMVKTVEDTNEIIVASLPEGVYVLRITDEKGTAYTERVNVVK